MRRLILFLATPLYALFSGNPGSPGLYKEGLYSGDLRFSVRTGAFFDFMLRQRYRDEFKLESLPSTPSFAKMRTEGGILTVNFLNKLDLYTLLAASRLELDEEIYTKIEFGWGVGGTLVIYHGGHLRIGLDSKYYETNQKPRFFLSEDYAYNILSEYRLKYSEILTSLGATYQVGPIVPYANLTYLYSKIDPTPYVVAVQLPFYDDSIDVLSKSVVAKKRWGLALGGTLLANRRATLTIESRLFNQNGINLSGQLRF